MSENVLEKKIKVSTLAEPENDQPLKLVENLEQKNQNEIQQTISNSCKTEDSAGESGSGADTELPGEASTGDPASRGADTDVSAEASTGDPASSGADTDVTAKASTGQAAMEGGAVSDLCALAGAGKASHPGLGLANALSRLTKSLEKKMGLVWDLRAPLFLLITVALVPKLVLLWIFVVIAKPCSAWLYRHCPEIWKSRLKLSLPGVLRNSPFLRDLNEGADQGLPFILFWLYLCCAPFAIAWIAVHWIRGCFQSSSAESKSPDSFVFTQNKRLDQVHSENNFYHSRAFGVVFFAFFALGIPAFFSYKVYETLGIERVMANNSIVGIVMENGPMPGVSRMKVGLSSQGSRSNTSVPAVQESVKAPTGSDATVIQGYNGYWPWIRNFGIEPNKASVFFVHFYLMSLGSALCMLFFRTWFMFPLNFASDEHDIEFSEFGIKRKSLKSWFRSVITFNRWATGGGPDCLAWSEVKGLRRLEEGFAKMWPLPETAFKKESLSYKLLNKGAAFIDGLSNQLNSGNYLIFSSSETEGDFGRNMRINLNDLSRGERAKLFYSVKKWAPHVVVNKAAEEQLLGSCVLRDNRYTQLWFDMLTTRTLIKRQNMLSAGDCLKGGEYTIDERISSGGQATAYLARKASGQKYVLKEFILASTSSGALLESAREFEAEVSLLSQLNHPGIVRLEDFFSEDGRVYVVLEYIEGQSLRQKVQQEGPLSENTVVEIAESICDVMEYLHGCNPPIVHRDITPENILVQPDGTIKLIDFSLAVKHDGRQTTDSCAKQCFTPPEQFREEVCLQSDIYALGATMYYLLTGLTPKPISISSPRTKSPQISTELNSIVERATQLDLSQRYESVRWLKLDLTKLNLEEGSRVTGPDPVGEP